MREEDVEGGGGRGGRERGIKDMPVYKCRPQENSTPTCISGCSGLTCTPGFFWREARDAVWPMTGA